MIQEQKDLIEFFGPPALTVVVVIFNNECGSSVGDAACRPPVNGSCGGGGE